MPNVGALIKNYRLKAGLSQRQLAAKVGVTFPHISKIEAGRETASVELLERIAREVDASADELVLAAEHVPDELRQAVAAKPDLAARFLRSWKAGRISDDDVRKLIDEEDH